MGFDSLLGKIQKNRLVDFSDLIRLKRLYDELTSLEIAEL